MKTFILLLKIGVVAAGSLLVAGWVFVSASFFNGLRQDIVGNLLTTALQQPVKVEGNIRIEPGRISKVEAGGVSIDSVTIPDTELATLGSLDFDLDTFALLRKAVDLDNLSVDELHINLLKDSEGRDSWKVPDREKDPNKSEDKQQTAEKDGHIIEFLRSRTVDVRLARLLFKNEISGFIFDFEIERLTFEQLQDGGVLEVDSTGTVNGQTFSLSATIPREDAFDSRFQFGGFSATYSGNPTEDGHTGKLTVASGQISDMLDVLALENSFDGTGRLETEVNASLDTISVTGMDGVFDFADGSQITVTGSVDQLLKLNGLDVTVSARFHPDNAPPAPAQNLRSIRPERLVAHIVGDKSDIEFEQLLLTTNAFKEEFDEIGPISVESIRRSPEGKLVLENIKAQAGPREAPYLALVGSVGDAMNLKGIGFSGHLSAPAMVFFPTLREEFGKPFGKIEGTFEVGDAAGPLGLTSFELHSSESDLWSLDFDAQLPDITDPGGLNATFDFSISETSDFLTALQLEASSSGQFTVNGRFTHEPSGIVAEMAMATDVSDLSTSFQFSGNVQNPVVSGQVTSTVFQITDARDAMKTLLQLRRLPEVAKEQRDEFQPLVLPDEETQADDGFQPLVLEKEENRPKDLLDPIQLIKDTELHIDVGFDKITGPRGTSSLSSELTAKAGKARLGPVDFRYGGGFFNFTAGMDIENSPKQLSLAGATGGWDFGDILKALEIDFQARGILGGNFSVTGDRTSLKAYINSMSGRAELDMSDGQMATSLLELAGLGIFPWIFSEERRQGYTDIVCAVAPVTFRAGRVGFDAVVAETRSVQLVARGEIDWRRDKIDLRVEPRRVGDPLARSAWPFDVTGALSEPKFKLDIGGSRSRRADGADEMPAIRKPCVPDIYQLQ